MWVFFLFLPWNRNNLVGQLLLGFVAGLMIDVLYNSLGVHAFAAVLLIYFRNFLLYLLSPLGKNHAWALRPTIKNMGISIFAYVLFLTGIYHTAVFALDISSFRFFLGSIPQLSLSILLSCLFILLPFVIVGVIGSTRSK